MALQRKQDRESTGYWPCSCWMFRKVTRRLVQGTTVESAGMALLAARGTRSPSPPPTSKPAFPGQAGPSADGAPGCWGQGEPPSCWAAWCQIEGRTPAAGVGRGAWERPRGSPQASASPAGMSDSPAFLLQGGGWHQTLTNARAARPPLVPGGLMAEEARGSPASAPGWGDRRGPIGGPSRPRWLSLHRAHTSRGPKQAELENLSGAGEDEAI